jgi:hypothetical protein
MKHTSDVQLQQNCQGVRNMKGLGKLLDKHDVVTNSATSDESILIRRDQCREKWYKAELTWFSRSALPRKSQI